MIFWNIQQSPFWIIFSLFLQRTKDSWFFSNCLAQSKPFYLLLWTSLAPLASNKQEKELATFLEWKVSWKFCVFISFHKLFFTKDSCGPDCLAGTKLLCVVLNWCLLLLRTQENQGKQFIISLVKMLIFFISFLNKRASFI